MSHLAALVRPFALLLLCSLAANADATEVYRWKDANGVTHYGERPPEGTEAEEVTIRKAPPVTPAEAVTATDEPAEPVDESNMSADERAEVARQRAIEAAAEARRQAREVACARARQNLQVLRQNNYVSLRDGDTTRTLDAAERDQQIAENEAAETTHCSPETEPSN
ncbi:DUF4124 domain-containing protein [Aquimonas sp.]|jgi:hypothetical protein|uniref:DUF4124 domain-containing protein n=1 Tax=Aquimonas sp. TaxID=1872588 RepID=UPI0037C1AE2D